MLLLLLIKTDINTINIIAIDIITKHIFYHFKSILFSYYVHIIVILITGVLVLYR